MFTITVACSVWYTGLLGLLIIAEGIGHIVDNLPATATSPAPRIEEKELGIPGIDIPIPVMAEWVEDDWFWDMKVDEVFVLPKEIACLPTDLDIEAYDECGPTIEPPLEDVTIIRPASHDVTQAIKVIFECHDDTAELLLQAGREVLGEDFTIEMPKAEAIVLPPNMLPQPLAVDWQPWEKPETTVAF